MLFIILVLFALACFGGVLLFGAPYLPTMESQIEATFEMAGLKAGDTLLELGCGDGRILIAAAREGMNAIGYELNPIMAFISWARTRRYRRQVKVVLGDFWRKEWPPTDVIFVFLLNRYMEKLDKKCMQYPHKPVKLISFAFKVPGKKPKVEKRGVFMYEYS